MNIDKDTFKQKIKLWALDIRSIPPRIQWLTDVNCSHSRSYIRLTVTTPFHGVPIHTLVK